MRKEFHELLNELCKYMRRETDIQTRSITKKNVKTGILSAMKRLESILFSSNHLILCNILRVQESAKMQ